MKLSPILIDADLARRLTTEAHRRDAEVGQLVHGTLAELLERLEGEDAAQPAGRWDRPEFYEYTFETHLTCDGCRAVFTLRSIGIDTDDAQHERAHRATIEASAKGWSVAGGHRCPACVGAAQLEDGLRLALALDDAGLPLAVAFADGTAPGTERLHGDRCMCAGAGCRERPAR